MQKGYLFSAGTRNRCLVDELHAGLLGACQLRRDVVGCERDVMNTFPTRSDRFGDGTLWGSGFEQFDMHATDVKESGLNLLTFNLFDALTGYAQDLLPDWYGFRQRGDGNAQVIDSL